MNGKVFVYPKYSTKDRTPWNFSFTEDEISQLTGIAGVEERVVVAFVCGGDGVCAVVWENVFALLGGPSQTWISCRRKFNQQYAVSGSMGKIKGKVAIQEWPSMVFSE